DIRQARSHSYACLPVPEPSWHTAAAHNNKTIAKSARRKYDTRPCRSDWHNHLQHMWDASTQEPVRRRLYQSQQTYLDAILLVSRHIPTATSLPSRMNKHLDLAAISGKDCAATTVQACNG